MNTVSELRSRLHRRFLADADPIETGRLSREALAGQVRTLLSREMQDAALSLTEPARRSLVDAVVSEIAGLGPLEPLLADPTITEIMVNGPSQVWVERNGKLFRDDACFDDAAHLRRIIERIVAPLGRRIDDLSPLVDGRLPDGSRVNAVLPPLAINGPTLTIRKFSRVPYQLSDLVRLGTLTPEIAAMLQTAVQGRLNILVPGGTGSGKTTLLNALSAFIPDDERILTIEDAAELRLQQAHVVTLESRPANLEGRGEITIRDLVRNALRMRPDRILLGEVRGGEALDLLQAMNTGHDGSLSTVHANSPRDALARLETMTLMAGMELPSRAIREQIASALHLIVHAERQRDGQRIVTQVTKIRGMEGEAVQTHDLVRYDPRTGTYIFEETA